MLEKAISILKVFIGLVELFRPFTADSAGNVSIFL
ncbi:hypothetical protein MKleb_5833 (plasmid) [Klebsiella sp. PL-2018]|nr:hypothetical protein MKleb_5833 [Klebsiella sp. PL-2018]